MTGWNCARVWRVTQLGSLCLTAAWALLAWRGGHPGMALGVVLGSLGAPLWALLLQAVWAERLCGGPGWRVRWRAVWAELGWNLRVFGWQQPWCAHRYPDTGQPTARRGVLLVHGHLCNRGFWLPWLRWLHDRGVPYATVDLWPMWSDIDSHAPAIDAALRRLTALTGQPPLVVAHSKGGLSVRAWWRWCVQMGQDEAGVSARVAGVITLASPHRGTRLAAWAPGAAARQMAPDGDWLWALASTESPAWRARLCCVASDADAVVYPPELASLPGSARRVLPGLAHIELAFDARVRELVWGALATSGDEPAW